MAKRLILHMPKQPWAVLKMKKYLLILLFAPFTGYAQVKNKANSDKSVNASKSNDGYVITGTISGYPDGTVVDLLNANDGKPELSSKIAGGKFELKGKLEFPDVKLIAFDKAPPYVTIFLDNSKVTISAKKDALETAVIKGSQTNEEYSELTAMLKPYDKLFLPGSEPDTIASKKCGSLLQGFIRKHDKSCVSLYAIYRNFQVSADADLMEKQFQGLSADVQETPIGGFIAQQIAVEKRNPIGKALPDFTQEDPTGKPVALSSLRGKYVLVDFWASWCGPCRQENPNVVNVYNRFKGKNFTVLGISLDKEKQKWMDAITADNLNWTHISDLKGWANSVAQQFQINSIPQNFLIDPSGVVIAKNLRGSALEEKLASILK
jgi:peroxiredoxin